MIEQFAKITRDRFSARTALLAAGMALFLGLSTARAEEPVATESPRLQLNVHHHTAPIRAITFSLDSTRLYSGGMDKQVHVWHLGEGRTKAIVRERDAEFWSYGRTLRWEVGEGLFGTIYGLAAGPPDAGVAIAGFSYRGQAGDVIRMQPDSGALLHWEHNRHVQTVAALASTADGVWILSRDLTGRTLARKADGAPPRELAGGEDRLNVPFRPLAVLGSRYVLIPRHVDNHTSGAPVWQLSVYDLRQLGGDATRISPVHQLAERFYGRELVLAGSRDGAYFAAADGTRRLVVIGNATGSPDSWRVETLTEGENFASLAWSTEGRLFAGTFDLPGRKAKIQFWDAKAKRLLRTREADTHVWACAASGDGRWLAYVGGNGNDLVVESAADEREVFTLSGGRQVNQIAAGEEGLGVTYATAEQRAGGAAARRFMPERLEAVAITEPKFTRETPSRRGSWSVVRSEPLLLELSQRGRGTRSIALDQLKQGRMQSWCWIDGPDGEPEAVAIGTDTQNGIYVYELVPAARRPSEIPVRWFRGHLDRITALSVSADRRYLVSGSADGTLRYWPLAEYRAERSVPRRWGAEFELLRDGGMRIRTLHDFGPLAAKGLRVGDRLKKMVWRSDNGENREAAGEEAYGQLSSLRDFTQVGFYFERGEGAESAELPVFQQMDGWPAALSYYDAAGEWIAWATSGYYACSAGGEQLVGWQVNQQKQGSRPEFYPAVRFSKTLYRPDVVQRLLFAGGVKTALEQAEAARLRADGIAVDAPPVVQVHHLAEIVEQTARVTRVEVASPAVVEGNRVQVEKDEVRIAAHVADAPPETRLTVMLNGSPWHAEAQAPGDVRREGGEWVIKVPRGRTEVAILAESGRLQGRYLSEPIVVEFEPQLARPTLWVLAIGVSKYGDNSLPALQYAHLDAAAISSVLERNGGELHNVQTRVLTNEGASRAAIEDGLAWIASNIKLGDVGVVFFAGHGVRKEKELFLLPSDAQLGRIAETGISESMLKQYCQKLGGSGNLVLMLDACYSGRMKFDELIRELGTDDYRVVAMASSKGDEVSLENPRWRGGAFTRAICEGLEGHADSGMYANKIVEHDELDVHVKRAVPILTDYQQHPLTNALYLGFDRPIALTQVP